MTMIDLLYLTSAFIIFVTVFSWKCSSSCRWEKPQIIFNPTGDIHSWNFLCSSRNLTRPGSNLQSSNRETRARCNNTTHWWRREGHPDHYSNYCNYITKNKLSNSHLLDSNDSQHFDQQLHSEQNSLSDCRLLVIVTCSSPEGPRLHSSLCRTLGALGPWSRVSIFPSDHFFCRCLYLTFCAKSQKCFFAI